MVAAVGNYTDYAALNGIVGSYDGLNSLTTSSLPIFNSYGMGGYYGGMDISQAKENLQNSYEYNALYQAYGNKQNMQSLSFNTACQDITTLLSQGRTDDAMQQYRILLNSMKAMPQYQECSEAELKAALRQQYAYATGTDLVANIDATASSSFVQGLKQGVPILGTFFANGNTKDDAIAEVTGVEQTTGSKVAKAAGSLISGVGSGAAIGAVVGSVPGAIIGGIAGGVLSLGKMIFGK